MPTVVRRKPNKPYPSFPLTAHPNGQWCKKIRGVVRFFGVWNDPDAALTRYHEQAADLHAGRRPRKTQADGDCTLKGLADRFLDHQNQRVTAGQIGARSYEDYRRCLDHFVRVLGEARAPEDLTAEDFQRYRTRLVRFGVRGDRGLGVHALGRALTLARGMFTWGESAGLIDRVPRWGNTMAKPTASDRRRSRATREREFGKSLFTPDETRRLMAVADPMLKAAILLGVNGGFGNTDVSALLRAALNLEAARIDFERPKTAVARVVPLWPETVDALRTMLNGERPKPFDESVAPLVFRSESGRPLVRQLVKRSDDGSIRKVTYVDRLGDRFDALLTECGLKRRGLGFYALRHTFRTWADETRDQHAIHLIMGHAIPGMSGVYIEEIGMDRLRAVTEHARAKLF